MTAIDPTNLKSHLATLQGTARSSIDAVYPLSTEAKIVLAILAIVAFWGFAIFSFGVPALVWPMMLIVPGLIAGLVLLTWGM